MQDGNAAVASVGDRLAVRFSHLLLGPAAALLLLLCCRPAAALLLPCSCMLLTASASGPHGQSKRMELYFAANKRLLLSNWNQGARDTGDASFIL